MQAIKAYLSFGPMITLDPFFSVIPFDRHTCSYAASFAEPTFAYTTLGFLDQTDKIITPGVNGALSDVFTLLGLCLRVRLYRRITGFCFPGISMESFARRKKKMSALKLDRVIRNNISCLIL
ncbi:hypothetical protein AA313_de0208169 [Arthrobotrys entomopaga]|nr:hypothetical protein AA313_de0208169 [Arthrobotrys entomopaga]